MKLLRLFLYLACCGLFAVLIGGYFGAVHPALDTLSHLRLHAAGLAVLLGLALAMSGGFLGGLSLTVSALLILVTTIRPYMIVEAAATDGNADRAVYRLMQVNLRFDNQAPNEIVRLIGETIPDIITADEVSAQWRPRLEALRHLYPHQLYCESPDFVGGVAILSRRPFAPDQSQGCSNLGAMATQVIDFGGRPVLVGAMHLDWPWPFYQPYLLNDMGPQLKAVALSALPSILSGDFNAVSWSYAMRRVEQESETRQALYDGGSWVHHALPASWIKWLGLPIDHVLVSDIDVRSIATLQPAGSDHLPVLMEFSVPDRPEKAVETVLSD